MSQYNNINSRFTGQRKQAFNYSPNHNHYHYQYHQNSSLLNNINKQITIEPTYLLTISSLVQILNQFYQQEKLGSLNMLFKRHLENSFSILGQAMFLYNQNGNNLIGRRQPQKQKQINHHNLLNSFDKNLQSNLNNQKNTNKSFIQSAILKTKSQIQQFCWQKLSILMLQKGSKQIHNIMQQLIKLNRQHYQDFQKIVIAQKKASLNQTIQEKDLQVFRLKQDIQLKDQHMKDIHQRLKQVQEENSSLYSKLIMNAKSTIEYSLGESNGKGNSLGHSKNHSPSKFGINNIISPRHQHHYSNATANFPKIKQPLTTHKTLTSKQAEDIIYDVMQTKIKQEAVKAKRKVSLDNFLTTYFRYKFGMRQLAEQAQSSFRQSIQFFSKNQQKNIFILFQSILEQKCNQSYFFQSKLNHEKIIKYIKKYINTKNNISLDQLDKIYEMSTKFSSSHLEQKHDIQLNEKDIHLILSNIYGTQQVQSLQNIFSEFIASKNNNIINLSNSNIQNNNLIPSKKIINQILNYQLKKYLFSIQDIIRAIHQVDSQNKKYFNYSQLQTIGIKSGLSNQRLILLNSNSEEFVNKFLTSSEIIEIILKLRKSKINNNNNGIILINANNGVSNINNNNNSGQKNKKRL